MIEPLVLLERFPRLATLSNKGRLAALATVVMVPPGAVLFREGDVSDAVLLVAEGRVALSMRFPGRPEVAMLTVGNGEMLGWSGLKPGARRVASGRVVEAVTLLEFPAAALHALCEADHDVGYALMRFGFEEVSLRLHDTRLQLLDMFARQDA